jgi:hypothetical protein
MRTHRLLDYEKGEKEKATKTVAFMSKSLYAIEKCIGKQRTLDVVWTYMGGFEFNNCTRNEMNAIQSVLGIHTLDKEISEHGVRFKADVDSCTTYGSTNYGIRKITLNCVFKFELPETCEVTYDEKWLDIPEDDIKISEDGKLSQKVITANVKCNTKEMMTALFDTPRSRRSTDGV